MDYEDEMLIGMSYEQFLAGLSDDDLDYKINCAQAQINGVPYHQGCAILTTPEQTLDSLLDERERRYDGSGPIALSDPEEAELYQGEGDSYAEGLSKMRTISYAILGLIVYLVVIKK
jgi:hypothetical protein